MNFRLHATCVIESTTVRDADGKGQNCDVLAKKALLSRLDAVDNPEYYGQPSPSSLETSPFIGPSQQQDHGVTRH